MAATAEPPRTHVRAEARYVRTAPRKAQLVAEQIRGRSVPEARTILAFMTRDAARDVERVLSSAVANAEANHNLDGDELYVSAATVGAGPTLKRWRARARGRVARIKKRTCHITIALALPEGGVIPAPRPAPAPAPEPAAEEEQPQQQEQEQEEEPKPKRAPRKKAEPKAETATEDKAKTTTRKRTTKPKADAEATAETEPKPKRTTTRKKESDS
jgi:large subunit ribosomal protein L22